MQNGKTHRLPLKITHITHTCLLNNFQVLTTVINSFLIREFRRNDLFVCFFSLFFYLFFFIYITLFIYNFSASGKYHRVNQTISKETSSSVFVFFFFVGKISKIAMCIV